VFDSRPCFPMKLRTIIVSLATVLLLGAGSASVLPSFGSVTGTADVEPAIQLVEVQYNPADDSTQEFVRVYNAGNEEIDLEGWQLSNNNGANTLGVFNDSYDTELTPGEYAYITEKEGESTLNISTEKNRLATEDSTIADGRLENSGDTVTIKYTDGGFIDSVTYPGEDSGGCDKSQSYQRDDYSSEWECKTSTLGGGSE
jgi:hypothetical protein